MMAEFSPALEKMLANEGGYVLHKNEHDRGGWTYAGIARNIWSNWDGWKDLDSGFEQSAASKVPLFYKREFWTPIRGDLINDQHVAESIFDFAVNAGFKVASKLAQLCVGVDQDGIIGPKTINAINAIDPALFHMQFTLAKIARYLEICRNDKSQITFFYGWIKRAFGGMK
jgi:lysozyme family protein